jgi:hypothetical protein
MAKSAENNGNSEKPWQRWRKSVAKRIINNMWHEK